MFKKTLALCVLALASSIAFAETEALPSTQVAADAVGHPTAHAAAVAILSSLSAPFADSEFGGAIVLRDGLYFATVPVSIGETTAVEFRVMKRATDVIVALFHTHPLFDRTSRFSPANSGGAFFSKGDVNTAHRLQMPMYLASEFGESIRVFDPQGGGRRVRNEKSSGEKLLDLDLDHRLSSR